MNRIITNHVTCVHCMTELRSYATHDFQQCKCGKVAIDGGLDYLKRVGDEKNYVDHSIVFGNL